MKKIIIIVILMGVSILSYSQTIGITFGTHLIQDKILTETPYDNIPRPFVFVGANYQHPTGVSISLTYTPNLHIITLTNTVPPIQY